MKRNEGQRVDFTPPPFETERKRRREYAAPFETKQNGAA